MSRHVIRKKIFAKPKFNPITPDFKNSVPLIIEELVKIYGEEYRELINKRSEKLRYYIYANHEGLREYYDFLIECKKIELSLQILKGMGLDTTAYNDSSYSEILKNQDYLQFGHIEQLDYMLFFLKECHKVTSEYKDILLPFFNFWRNGDTVTADTFDDFIKSSEYKTLFLKLSLYNKFYTLKLLQYEKSIKKYLDLSRELECLKSELLSDAMKNMYQKLILKGAIPKEIEEHLNMIGVNDLDKAGKLFGPYLDGSSYIDYFTQEKETLLNDESYHQSEKNIIRDKRKKYFLNLGIDINSEGVNFEKIKPLVPPNYLIDMISRMKKEELEKLKRNYLVACAKTMSDSSEFMETEIGTALLYDKPEVCVLSKMLPNDDFLIILNYTVRIGEWGKQDYTFIHEFIHAIDCFSADDCGFDDNREEIGKSPYQNKRKYERLNETLTDMLAMEVRNNLHRKGIYFAEDKEFIIYDVEDDNTNHLLKEILKPLVDKYKKQIIEAKLTGRKEVLFDLIGLDNFENLNDALDMVDSLIKKEFEKSEVLMEEYSKQMERISAIYENMGITFNLMKI